MWILSVLSVVVLFCAKVELVVPGRVPVLLAVEAADVALTDLGTNALLAARSLYRALGLLTSLIIMRSFVLLCFSVLLVLVVCNSQNNIFQFNATRSKHKNLQKFGLPVYK